MSIALEVYNWRDQIRRSPNGKGIIRQIEIPLLSIARQAAAAALHAGSGGHPVFALVGAANTPPGVLRFTTGQAAVAFTQLEIPLDYDNTPHNSQYNKYGEGDHCKLIMTALGSSTARDMTINPIITRVGGGAPTVADVVQEVVSTTLTRYEFDLSGNNLQARDILGLQLTAEGTVASNIDVYSLVLEYRGNIVNTDESNR